MNTVKFTSFPDKQVFDRFNSQTNSKIEDNGANKMNETKNTNNINANAVKDNKIENKSTVDTGKAVTDTKVDVVTDVDKTVVDTKKPVVDTKVDEKAVDTEKTDIVDTVGDAKVTDEKSEDTDVDDLEEYLDETKKVKEEVKTEPVKRTTRLDKSRTDKTFKFLFKNRDKLKFDLAIQRNEVWTQAQKDGLIDSIVYGYPVPPVMVAESDDGNFWFLDGKQRGTTIVSFIADEWAMSKKAKPILGVEVAGKKFSELPEEFREYIYDETITLIKLKGLSDEERDEMFVRWNSGSVLSKIELTRAKHSALISQINELAEHEFFATDIAMTNTGRNRFQDQEIVMQIAMLLEKGRDGIKGFGSKEIDEFVMEMKKENKTLTKALMTRIKAISNFMNMVASELDDKQKKKILKKANTPIVFYQASKLIEEKIKPNIFSEFLIKFLDEEYNIDSDYGQSLQSGVSKRENVVIRLNEMELAFNEFVEEIKKSRDEKEIYKSKK